jgi:hypothetical protein
MVMPFSRPVVLDMHYLGKWKTPLLDADDAGSVARLHHQRLEFAVEHSGNCVNLTFRELPEKGGRHVILHARLPIFVLSQR